MPHAIFDCMGVFLRSGFAHVDNVIPMIPMIKAITWLLLSRLQGNKPHRNFPEPSEPFLLNLRQHTPEPSEIFQNLPELASGTYTVLHRNSPEPSGTCLGNLHHFTKELSGTFRNPPPEPTPAHSGTLRNLPEPSGTCLGNLHRFTMFYTGTLRNLPEPASGTYTILQRNYPEPSGTCLRNIHQHTPELSGTFRNLPPEPAPATRTGTHRSLSGLKTPLAYAVGEKKIEAGGGWRKLAGVEQQRRRGGNRKAKGKRCCFHRGEGCGAHGAESTKASEARNFQKMSPFATAEYNKTGYNSNATSAGQVACVEKKNRTCQMYEKSLQTINITVANKKMVKYI